MTIKRSAFDVYGPFRENVYGSDTALCWNLRRHGLSPFFDPSIRVEHHCTLGYRGLLRRQFERGRTFGAMRGREQALSRPARWLHAAAAPAATLRMLLRKLALVRGAGTYRLPFVLCTPLLTAGIAAWYLGQSAGFIAGAAAVRNAVTDGVSE
jgi:GT2 family glycosyltransferase